MTSIFQENIILSVGRDMVLNSFYRQLQVNKLNWTAEGLSLIAAMKTRISKF